MLESRQGVIQALHTSSAEGDLSGFPLNIMAYFCAQLTYQIAIDSATPESTTASWSFFQNLLIFSAFCAISGNFKNWLTS